MWDTSITYHDGRYYLFAMYQTGRETENSRRQQGHGNSVWCAVSDDGVHWEDVGAVIDDQPFEIAKMFVRRLGDRFIMNHGSLTEPDRAPWDTLRFWESADLVNWQPLSENLELRPDPRWYRTEGIWDHMYMLPNEAGTGYLGYCVAGRHDITHSVCGVAQSDDGVRWQALPPPVVEWGDIPPLAHYEVGGCERVDGRYYLIGGAGAHLGGPAYGVYTFVSEHWNGPFRPDVEAYRLCGSTGIPGTAGVQWLASFARGEDDELLITNYLTDDTDDSIENSFSSLFSHGDVWFLPVKKAIVDDDGHLRMGYWPQNDRLKGAAIEIGVPTLVYPESPTTRLGRRSDGITLDGTASDADGAWLFDTIAIATVEPTLDLERGAVVEGTLTIDSPTMLRPAKAGFYFEETETSGTYLLLEAADPLWRTAEIGSVEWNPILRFEPRDVTRHGAATVTGITAHQEHRLRILYRRNIFEVYIDDLLVQTFTTAHTPTGRWGFIVQNARCTFDDVRIWQMTLEHGPTNDPVITGRN